MKGGVDNMRRVTYNSRGFTLVELLIVIVIIGILAGVVIGVLNPVQQQNRARDGTLRASMSKMALAAKSMSASSTNGAVPTGAEFFATVGGGVGIGAVTASSHCSSDTQLATSYGCNFTVNGISMPTDCTSAGGGYSGVPGTAAACFFNYYHYANGAAMRLTTKNFANPRATIVYEFVQNADGTITEGFYNCPALMVNTTAVDPTPTTGNCTRYNN